MAVCLVVACVLSTIPIVEMGLNDDWSYMFIARGLARTGHLRYDGWVTPMIGFQAWWAAVWIRLFGFSFTLVRFSTLPFAAGCALLIYRLSREAGVNSSFSLFATLTVTLSPLFIPLAASFMTDIPGLFFWLACIYSGMRAARVPAAGTACGWLAASAGSGWVGGTVRQSDWIAPLLIIPAVALIRRRERLIMVSAAAYWCIAALLILICFRWFQAQPYVQIESYSFSPKELFSHNALATPVQLPVASLMFVLPILLLYVTALRKNSSSPSGLLTGLVVMGALILALNPLAQGHLLLGNTVTTTGIISSAIETFGGKPVSLTEPILIAIKILLFASGAAMIAAVMNKRSSPDRQFRLFLLLCAPPASLYVLVVFYHTLDENVLFDRYLLELLPLLAIALLWHYQQTIRAAGPASAWLAAGILALYGTATTHDAFAAARARVQAASELIAAGIPRTQITAGFAYDGWTELEHSGHINSDNMVNPPHVYRSQEDRHYAISPPYWFWDFTPDIEPKYFVDHSRISGLVDASFPPVPFIAWLPPFHRQAIIQRDPASAAVR